MTPLIYIFVLQWPIKVPSAEVMTNMQLLIFLSLSKENIWKENGWVLDQDLLFLYIVFNRVMGSFACL